METGQGKKKRGEITNSRVGSMLNSKAPEPHLPPPQTHPHRDMEIVTYVIDGELTHRDSMGTEETLGRGCE